MLRRFILVLLCLLSVSRVKAVQFSYKPTDQIMELLETFRDMVNEAIRVGLEKGVRSRFSLIRLVYGYFKERYGLHTHYILNACEVAFSIIKKHRRWQRKPYAKRVMIKLDNQTYQLNYMMLRIPVKPREFILIPLKGGEYQLSYLRDETLKRGSITITPNTITVAFSKTADAVKPLGKVAYDINEKNITGVSSDGEVIRYDLSQSARIRTEYAERRSRFQEKKPKDRRVKQKVLSKLGRREKERAKRMFHNISKAIVEHAKKSEAAIVLETLRNILFSHRRGNGESRTIRARLHRWSFRELQRQIEYKAKWEGIVVECVSSTNTSKICSNCGYVNKALKNERGWLCPSCGAILDRDVNAAKNILSRSKLVCLPVVRGGAPSK